MVLCWRRGLRDPSGAAEQANRFGPTIVEGLVVERITEVMLGPGWSLQLHSSSFLALRERRQTPVRSWG